MVGLGLYAPSQGTPAILIGTHVPREAPVFRCILATSAIVLLERLADFAIQVYMHFSRGGRKNSLFSF
jgi:hypothetical protein